MFRRNKKLTGLRPRRPQRCQLPAKLVRKDRKRPRRAPARSASNRTRWMKSHETRLASEFLIRPKTDPPSILWIRCSSRVMMRPTRLTTCRSNARHHRPRRRVEDDRVGAEAASRTRRTCRLPARQPPRNRAAGFGPPERVRPQLRTREPRLPLETREELVQLAVDTWPLRRRVRPLLRSRTVNWNSRCLI